MALIHILRATFKPSLFIIRSSNWLYDKKDGQHLKLIDFGLSKFWGTEETMGARVGTLCNMAPEVLEGAYTSQCDMWSLGVMAYTMLCGDMPFSGANGDEAIIGSI